MGTAMQSSAIHDPPSAAGALPARAEAPASGGGARALEATMRRLDRRVTVLASFALVALIAAFDVLNGPEGRLAILYLVPVALATWTGGVRWGVAVALTASIVWAASFWSLHAYSNIAYFWWDGLALLATLVVFCLLFGRLHTALEHSDERFVRVLDGIDALVYVTDDEGNLPYANRRLAARLGDAGPPTVDAIAATFTAHGEGAPARPADWADGTELVDAREGRHYVVQARDITWVDRRRAHLVVLTDVTDQKLAQELRHEHQEAMHRTARIMALTEATSAVAHELNQPLLAIVGYNAACLRLLDDAASDPNEIRAAMDKCRAQAVRAGEILRRLRELTRRRAPEFVPCNLNACVRKALAWIAHDLERARVAVDLDLDPRVPGVRGDRVLIEQVILNLVHNAIEAMQEMPPAERRLRIATTVERDGARVAVADRGHGIAPEVSERLYSSFFTTKPGGLGLGLSICRSIVEMHGGRIGHATGEGGGAVFHILLPRVSA